MSDEFDGLDATEKAAIGTALNRCRALAAKIANELRNKRPEHFVDKLSLADVHASLVQRRRDASGFVRLPFPWRTCARAGSGLASPASPFPSPRADRAAGSRASFPAGELPDSGVTASRTGGLLIGHALDMAGSHFDLAK